MLSLQALAPATRTIPRAVAAVAAVVLVPIVVTRVRGGTDTTNALLLASLLAGSGAGYAVDDRAARTFASSPTPLVVRRALRAALASAPLVAAWVAAFVVAATSPRPGPTVAAMLPYAVAAGAIALAAATRVAPDAAASPGLIGVFTALLSILLVDALSLRFAALPSLRGGDRAEWWWVAALAALAALHASRDPAARLAIRRRR